MFGCRSLHQIPSVAGRSLSDDIYARLLSAGVAEYCKQCQGGLAPSPGVDLIQLHLYPAHVVGRTNSGSKVLWLGWWPNPSIGRLAWFQDVAGSGSTSPIARVLARVIRTESWEFLLS